ncbi:NAD(P)H-hydrate dehydratase [Sterolibacterium denitrificans]|nr:NAD(P)H-hydrate dehydratase [Sterolibacterium denitrificans]
MSQPILCAAALRDIEQRQRQADPPLMERAGQAASQLALRLLADRPRLLAPLIIAGPGNNGGDAFVVARLLRQAGFPPRVIFVGHADQLPGDARKAHDQWIAAGGTTLDADALPTDEAACALVIDGLFGIGLTRPLTDAHATLVRRINAFDCPILALDIPSGLDAATGRVLGVAVRATHTLSFIALKPGLLTLDGPDHCGEISVHDLELGSEIAACAAPGCGRTVSRELFAGALRPRPRNSHKGSYGSVGILGGAAGMAGAALLAGRAALALGGGRVYLGMLERLAVDPQQPELMLRAPEEIFGLADCLAIGPGLGQSAEALALLTRAVDGKLPLLLDADALNLCAAHPDLLDRLASRGHAAPVVLTPHPAEAARLLQTDIASIQADRLAAAQALARRSNAAIVLKGCGSIIALPDGRWYINTAGNPGLASAGSGDVLSGMLIALIAQGWPAAEALLAAVHLHGNAADACVAAGSGPIGLTASELIPLSRSLLNRWVIAAAEIGMGTATSKAAPRPLPIR